ncbi:MAG: MFS transporter [Candidatus Krumholzibacteriia bacterium]|nr:MFS transporter [Candidatus Latescibacterota bacterium]
MFRDRNLLLLAAGQFASRLGDASFHLALIWFAKELTGSKRAMGLVAMLEYLPILLFGALAGVLVDRLDRRRVMLGASLARSALMWAVPLVFLAGYRGLGAGAAAALGLALATSLFTPARDALVPQLVGRGDRVGANALVQVSDQFAWLLGPLVYPLLVPWLGVSWAFAGPALIFLVSWALLLGMRGPTSALLEPAGPETLLEAGETGGPPPGAGRLAWDELKAGFALAWKRRELRWLLLLTAVNNFFIMGPAIVAMPAYVGIDLGLPAGYLGAIESVLAAGMILGSLALLRWRPRAGMGKLWLVGMAFDGLTYVPMLLGPPFRWLVPLILFHALFIPWITVYRVSIVQEVVAPALQGRAFAFVGMAVVGMTALASGVTGLLLDVLPTHILFGTWGFFGMCCGLVGFAVPSLRRL